MLRLRELMCYCLLAVLLPSAWAGVKWERMATLSPDEGNYSFRAKWDLKAGMHLRLAQQDGKQSLYLFASSKKFDIRLGPSLKEAKPVEQALIGPENLPKLNRPSVDVLLKVRNREWWLYMNQIPVILVPPVIRLPGELFLESSNLIPSHRRVHQQKVADMTFRSTFMQASEEEDEDLLKNWTILGGKWKVATAHEEAVKQKTSNKLKSKPLLADHSPNFAKLVGTGIGQMVAGYGFEDNYQTSASIELGPAAGGILFYYQGPRDYYCFGLDAVDENDTKTILKLMRYSSVRTPRVQTMAKVEVPAFQGQWVQLKARAWGHRIECYIDNTKVIDLKEDLPGNGKFGLYVEAQEDAESGVKGLRFDDFDVRTVKELLLRTVGDVRFYTIASHNDIYDEESAFMRFFRRRNRNSPGQSFVESSLSGKERWIALGSAKDGPHDFTAQFDPRTRVFDVGILAGFLSVDQPYYRLRYVQSTRQVHVRIEKVDGNETEVIREYRRNQNRPPTGTTVNLKIRSDDEGVLRCYVNDKMVLVHALEEAVRGASGVFLGPGTKSIIQGLNYSFEPLVRFENKFEKNKFYLKDNYMKHWSSPEGEWYTDPKTNETWHKSDFFGAYSLHMPLVANTTIYPSVEEGEKESTLHLRVNNTRHLELRLGDVVIGTSAIPDDVLQRAMNGDKKPAFALHYEDHCMWVSSGSKLLLYHRLVSPLRGTRIRIKGLRTEDLTHSFARRSKVKDFLFAEALHDWATTSGTWQVTNRFMCKPEWSHLNGQSEHDLAAMWAKYQFKGDFCVEFYAGLRHGWYNKPGRDFNLTVMNRRRTPSEGYTVTCTGWDPNESQRWTRLYRNGKMVAQTDLYTAPRVRHGNKRKLYESVLRRGRDVHGAWYYIKMRRRGKKLEYYFDNELVLSYEDDSPIDLGSLGVWTYRNSMMVARVKFAAEHLEPTATPFRLVFRQQPKKRETKQVSPDVLAATNSPLNLNQSAFWSSELATSHGVHEWHMSDARPYFTFTNKMGGGPSAVYSTLPPMKLSDVVGVTFKVKRTAGAQFDFYYEVGQMLGTQFAVKRRFYHRISGSDLDTPVHTKWGETPVPPVRADHDWHEQGDWTPVTVRFPSGLISQVAPGHEYIRITGFGSIQPSYAQQGLTGNAPGAGYAIRDFSLIRTFLPRLKFGADAREPVDISVQDVNQGRTYEMRSIDELERKLTEVAQDGFNHVRVRAVSKNRKFQEFAIHWRRLSDKPVYEIKWHPELPDTVLISNPLRDQRVARATLLMDNKRLALEESSAQLTAKLLRPYPETINLRFTIASAQSTLELKSANQARKSMPILTKLDGRYSFYQNFETGDIRTNVLGPLAPRRMFDPKQGCFARFQNRLATDRLTQIHQINSNLAHTPVLYFRYRAEKSSQVSIKLSERVIAFSEELENRARPVAFSKPAVTDEKWHSWIGMVSEVPIVMPLRRPDVRVDSLQIGSTSKRPQTGKHSCMDIDDITMCPAVKSAKELQVVPHYACPGGIMTVSYAIHAGAKPYDELVQDEIAGLTWRTIANLEPVEPDLDALPDGLHHLFLVATGNNGVRSQVSSFPFLLDRKPIRISHVVTRTLDFNSNGQKLVVHCDTDSGAPLDLQHLKFSCGGEDVVVRDQFSKLIHGKGSDRLELNWPHMLRSQIQQAKPGSTITLKVDQLTDGAGNVSPSVSIPFKIGAEKDLVGPSYSIVRLPADRLLIPNEPWLNPNSRTTTIKQQVEVIRNFGDAPYVRAKARNKGKRIVNHIWMPTANWDVKKRPYLTLSLKQLRAPLTDLYLQLKGATGKNIRVSLKPYIKLRANIWQSVILDIDELLTKRFGQHKDKIWQVSLYTVGPSKHIVDIRDFNVLSAWQAQDALTLEAYDISGLSRYEWEIRVGNRATSKGQLPLAKARNGKARTRISFNFGKLTAGLPESAWLQVYAVDRAGNYSRPIRLPLPKTTNSR